MATAAAEVTERARVDPRLHGAPCCAHCQRAGTVTCHPGCQGLGLGAKLPLSC